MNTISAVGRAPQARTGLIVARLQAPSLQAASRVRTSQTLPSDAYAPGTVLCVGHSSRVMERRGANDPINI